MITPQTQAKQLARALGLTTGLYLKREDLHPHGSHKGRSIPLMIEKYLQLGNNNFCISSSGNAAISAAITINKYNVKHKKAKLGLKIFVGKSINTNKLNVLKKLLNKEVVLEKSANPKQSAFQIDKNGLAKNLRQSTDDAALIGYTELAKELSKIKDLSAVFVPTSSGTTAQGLYEEFKKLKLSPQIHIVQTQSCHPIADAFNNHITKTPTSPSIAGAIVDKVAHRKEKVVAAIKTSNGNGWICNNKEIKTAINLLKKTEKIKASPNSALAVAGLEQAIKNNWGFSGPVVCILTGR